MKSSAVASPRAEAPVAPVAPLARDLGDYAARYAELPFEALQVEFRRRVVLEVVQGCRAQHVLEVGCGLEPLAEHVAQFTSWTIVEPATMFADAARRRLGGDARVRVLEATIEAVAERGWDGGPAPDLILLSSLLHEVPSPADVLRGVAALCGSRTLVHVNVPNATSLHRELAVAMGLIPAVSTLSPQQRMLQQGRIFDRDSLEQLVRDAGLEVLQSGGYLLKPFTHAQMQALVDGGTIDRTMLEGLHELGRKFPALASEIYVNARRR